MAFRWHRQENVASYGVHRVFKHGKAEVNCSFSTFDFQFFFQLNLCFSSHHESLGVASFTGASFRMQCTQLAKRLPRSSSQPQLRLGEHTGRFHSAVAIQVRCSGQGALIFF